MEGLRCPICNAISLVNSVNDGEMFTCPFCNYRYTVTSVRKYFLHPQSKDLEELSCTNWENSLKDFNFDQLVVIIQSALKEISRRFPQEPEYSLAKKASN